MKKYNFKVMARVYEDVEIEAENEQEAREKFNAEHGDRFTQDWDIDGVPSTVLLNPDQQEGESLYDVNMTISTAASIIVSAVDAEEAVKKVQEMWDRCDISASAFDAFLDEPFVFHAFNQEDELDEYELEL